MPEKGLVFISCGQYTEPERSLGRSISRLVEETTPFQPYFADVVNDLDGLTRHIFERLNEAIGLIAVMHHRGRVQTSGGEVVRGSVWIEQEIAIAAFVRQVLGRKLFVAPFVQRGIAREGVRDQLILNPYEFDSEDEVLRKLREILPRWSESLSPEDRLRPLIEAKSQGAAKKLIEMWISNDGKTAVREFRAEILVPKGLVPPGMSFGNQQADLSTDTQIGILRTETDFPLERALPLYPGKRLRIFGSDFELGEAAWLRRHEIGEQRFAVRLRVPDETEATETEVSVNEIGLQEFTPPEPIEVMESTGVRHSAVREFIDAAAASGQTLGWKYESEILELKYDGHPYCFVSRRRVVTHAHRNRGDRSKPPEYLVWAAK